MRDKVITNKKIIFSHSVAKDHSKKLPIFLSERFYSVNQSHNSAILIGSSLAHQNHDIKHDQILDSSGTFVTTDEAGVIHGARIAVTDGLGGGAGDPKEDKEIYRVSHASCDAFLDSDEDIDTALISIGHLTSTRTDAHACMAAFTYKFKQGKRYSGEFANIGDGLIVVLDKHHKIKQTLCARHVYRGFGTWTPSSVQMYAKTSNKDNVLVRKTLELAEGDIVVSMTDGIWGELASNLISETETQRDIDIDPQSFEALFDKLGDVPYPSSFDIAQIIASHAMAQSLRRRQTLVELIFELEQQGFQEKSIKTINEALIYLDKTGMQKTANTLRAILFQQALNDGIIYFDNVEIPLDIVMRDLKSRTVGDCSTINVTRIPYHLDELIRCFIAYPERRQVLLPQLDMTMHSEADLKAAFRRLSFEVMQSEVDSKLSDVHFEPTFKKETLDKTHTLLMHYFRLSHLLNGKMDYQKLLDNLNSYLTQEKSLEKNDITLLLSMLNDKIKPKKGFFHTLLGENQNKLYKSFYKQLESHFLSDKTDNQYQPN
ncbi:MULTISPECIES: phosphocholine hydrolase Lem3 [Legionella]|uniref:phosphocholine hydrolase Lem3 n=1 Tax=Legionella TaxID=445 RepID=UPI00095AA471|nr:MULTISPECIES: phosphocholine hydrolase Lem3 [Legionella]MBN9225732.1 phosphocholine hydrolase Lem3 [Legionella steelei]OJW10658.1 MAG: phosphocholine hydrolase Lem3 [Legionella sp. 39-23]